MVDTGERIRILVLGDSGVGKTSLVHLITNNTVKPTWTVGCNLEVVLHESNGKSEFIELWDMGGSFVHENSRYVFLRGTYHGLILVHDLTNSKSYTNMIKWALELAWKGEKVYRRQSREAEINLIKSIDIPALVVGTKQDHLWSRSRYSIDRTGLISELNAQMISVNCLDHLQFKNSYQQQQISGFFDQVLAHKKAASTRYNRQFRQLSSSGGSSSAGATSGGVFSALDLGAGYLF